MRPATGWCGLAAFGAGLILCAVAAGSPALVAAVLLALAVAEFGWAVLALRWDRIPAPRAAIAVAVLVVASVTLLLFTGTVGIVPLLALLLLHWTVAVLAAFELRRSGRAVPSSAPGRAGAAGEQRTAPDERPAARWPRAGTLAVILTVQAMLVAAVTTPALANTAPGEFALPHGISHEH
ncbi:hypothetical protein [Leucobacter massiliensis]|uniref:Uncharacterized protein n=1 Tax=Leucobacter massiliensis TaxID=1686285 RepID=A0A2S9QQI8_9MICO|nr:hypothetical protein [Leucobacter massiliensis]PRI11845.1 hypothetical protein B4915_05290 [Leucobacter massiliensis]